MRDIVTKVWVAETALERMTADAQEHFPLETGGVLVGYFADNGDAVIRTVIGAGPGARHQRLRFEPDHGWQCHRLDELYAGSKGLMVYLGDWHTHPRGSPSMSWLDRRTLLKIAQHPEARCASPLMVIGAGGASQWEWVAHRYCGTTGMGLFAQASRAPLQPFKV